MKVAPSLGWHGYMKGTALVEFVVSLSRNYGWTYMSPTSDTIVVESPRSTGSVYLAIRGEKVVEAVLYPPSESDLEFDRAMRELGDNFGLQEQNG